MHCPGCHSENPDDSRFCANCGVPLAGGGPVSSSPTTWFDVSPEAGRSGALVADKYRILEEIGSGGMGVVLKAEDTKLKRVVALKLLSPELSRQPEARRRFLREAQSAAALDHPHICTIYEVGECAGKDFIAMAYIEGQSLKEKISQGALLIDEALDIAVQVTEGLGEAHRRGIIHRDIKPANIMLSGIGKAKITDFGLARLEGGPDITRTAVVLGTVAYMSPEQALGRQVDLRSDLWSLGCTLYEMLAGRAPFRGETALAVAEAIVHGEPEPIAVLRSDLPAGLATIVARCLEKDPQRRYADAADLVGDLKVVQARCAAAKPSTFRQGPPSMAVLPFVDMSPAKDQEYLGDGIAEELINALVRVQDLRVVARTSAFAFKGANVDVREIGQKLNVDTVLEGSVRTFGNRLRITAQLISVADGFHLWSERFDRELADVFAIQDEISLALVAKLKGKLLAGEETVLRRRSTADHEAYNLYLKGLHFVYRPDPESLARALSFFRDAVAKDPDFALAHTGIATAYANLGIMNLAPPAEMLPEARASLQQALELDPDLAEAQLGSATLAFWFEWDWEEADRSLERALALNPGSAMAHGMRAWLRLHQRRFDDAIRDIDEALSLDPLKPVFYAWSVGLRAAAGRLDEALGEFAKAMEIDPRFGLAHFHAGVAYIRKGLLDEATQALERGRELVVFPGWTEGLLGLIQLKRGDRERASRILQEMIEARTTSNVSAAAIAWLAAALGRYDEAFAYLDQAYEDRDTLMIFVHVYIEVFSSQLRSDPRYKAVLRRIRIAE